LAIKIIESRKKKEGENTSSAEFKNQSSRYLSVSMQITTRIITLESYTMYRNMDPM